jgi:hypothetical protein
MIYEFKCRATGTVVMTQAVAERILQTIGKPAEAKGIITQAQMGPAIDALRQAVIAEHEAMALDRAQARAEGHSAHQDTKQRDEQTCLPGISFSQRAQPFIEMLERAQSAGRDVTWGV